MSGAKRNKIDVFQNPSILKAFLSLAIPTVVSQLINTVYNLADTFWVGQLNSPHQLAALSIVFPAQLFLTALGNLFGMGAGTLLSRNLGANEPELAKRSSAFGLYGGIVIGLLCSLLISVFRPRFLSLIGANEAVYPYVSQYVTWVLVIGAAPSVYNAVAANIIRGEGLSRQASFGLSMGGILNIILDPFFVLPFGLNLQIKGAAIATLISTLASTLYFSVILYRRRKVSVITLSPKYFTLKRNISLAILAAGLPIALQTLFASMSNMVLNNLIMEFGETAEAAIGIAKKIDTIPMSILQGLSLGAVPLIAYNFGAGNYPRMQKCLKVSLTTTLVVGFFFLAILQIFAGPISSVFIADAETQGYAESFMHLHSMALPLIGVTFIMTSYFQAAAFNKQALILSFVRKGAVDIPLMFLMNMLIPMYGVIACQPIADTTSAVCATIMYLLCRKQLDKENVFTE